MSEVQEVGKEDVFLNKARAHFGDPKLSEGVNEADFYADFYRELGYYSDRCLDLAWQQLVSSKNKRVFPLVAECREACRAASRTLSAEEPPKLVKRDDGKCAHEDAGRLICSPMGRQAAEDGWVVGMYDFCLEHRRYPNLQEAQRLKAKSAATWAELAEFENDPATMPNALAWIKTFKKRRGHLSQIACGKVAA